jgi:sarcosine oxidase delta subunit
MPRRDCRWAIMLRVDTDAASSRYRCCFELIQILVRVETDAASSGSTPWEAHLYATDNKYGEQESWLHATQSVTYLVLLQGRDK